MINEMLTEEGISSIMNNIIEPSQPKQLIPTISQSATEDYIKMKLEMKMCIVDDCRKTCSWDPIKSPSTHCFKHKLPNHINKNKILPIYGL